MVYDIRNISNYIPNVHSRYFIDTNGIIYTSISARTSRITINGTLYNINGFKKSNLSLLSRSNPIISLPKANNYFLLYDGTILKRMKTRINKNNEVDVSLTWLDDSHKNNSRIVVHRIMGKVFLGLKEAEEVHHIDRDRTNNKLENLKILTFEEHRSKKLIK